MESKTFSFENKMLTVKLEKFYLEKLMIIINGTYLLDYRIFHSGLRTIKKSSSSFGKRACQIYTEKGVRIVVRLIALRYYKSEQI